MTVFKENSCSYLLHEKHIDPAFSSTESRVTLSDIILGHYSRAWQQHIRDHLFRGMPLRNDNCDPSFLFFNPQECEDYPFCFEFHELSMVNKKMDLSLLKSGSKFEGGSYSEVIIVI